MDDDKAEDAFRRGLRDLAGEVDTTGAERLLPPARRSRRTPLLVAAAVAAVMGGVALTPVFLESDEGPQPQEPAVLNETTAFVPEAGWRTEHWQGLAIDVPADWGYGGAPFRVTRSDREPAACWPSEMVDAAGTPAPEGESERGYVGRPMMLTDVCDLYRSRLRTTPAAPYVWLGAEIDAGVVDYDGGLVQETVVVDETTVTVASADQELREAVLASVRRQGVCAAELSVEDTAWAETSSATGTNVCVYRRLQPRRDAQLTAAITLADRTSETYRAAIEKSGAEARACFQIRMEEWEWVVLEQVDEAGRVTGRDVVHLGACAGIDQEPESLGAGEREVGLTPAVVMPWVIGPVPATVNGPTGGKGAMIESFLGMPG